MLADLGFAIEFPPGWQVLSVDDPQPAVDHLLGDLKNVDDDPELAAAASNYFTSVTPLLRKVGIDALASLIVGSRDPLTATGFAMASAAVTRRKLSDETPVLDALESLAEAGSPQYPVVERNTDVVDHPAGPAVRVSTLRHAAELADPDGIAPFVLDVRYAMAITSDVAVVLLFQTPTIGYLDELSALFDAVAGSVRVNGRTAAAPG